MTFDTAELKRTAKGRRAHIRNLLETEEPTDALIEELAFHYCRGPQTIRKDIRIIRETDDPSLIKVWIYGLVDPRTGVIMYVGQTRYPSARDKVHWDNGLFEGTKEKRAWVDELKTLGIRFNMVCIEQVLYPESDEREVYWIMHHRRMNPGLLNSRRHVMV